MSLHLYNSLTRTIEAFAPIQPGCVGIYLCGPTVYDHAHIGHARSAILFDVLARYLRFEGHAVRYVRNFTDIDEKIIKRAQLQHVDYLHLAETFILSYREDMKALGVASPDFEPRVTENIDVIQEMIARLVSSGHAYVRNGDVLYRVSSQGDYGLLGGTGSDKNATMDFRAAALEFKEDHRDFALWKRTKDEGQTWDSPWGRGRPGWHIECVAMSQRFLGGLFDIHGGGRDLIFPHHENERVLSQSAAGTNLARYWMHHEFVTVNGNKLSKSKDHPLCIRDLYPLHHPEAIRLLLLSTHYRRPLNFTERRLNEATAALDRLYGLLRRFGKRIELNRSDSTGHSPFFNEFRQAMNHDLNIPHAIARVFASVRTLNGRIDERGSCDRLPDCEWTELTDLLTLCRDVLGILCDRTEYYFDRNHLRTHTGRQADGDQAGIEGLPDIGTIGRRVHRSSDARSR